MHFAFPCLADQARKQKVVTGESAGPGPAPKHPGEKDSGPHVVSIKWPHLLVWDPANGGRNSLGLGHFLGSIFICCWLIRYYLLDKLICVLILGKMSQLQSRNFHKKENF